MGSFFKEIISSSSKASSNRLMAIMTLLFSFLVIISFIINIPLIGISDKFDKDSLNVILNFFMFVLGIFVSGSTLSKTKLVNKDKTTESLVSSENPEEKK